MAARQWLRAGVWLLGIAAVFAAAACSTPSEEAASEPTEDSGMTAASEPQSHIDAAADPPDSSSDVQANVPDTEPTRVPGGEPAQFVSMWGYERGDGANQALLEGTLVIEAPCVFLVGNNYYEGSGEPRLERALLQLPRSGTRFDAETGEVWVWDNGPFVTGDQVGAGGGGGSAGSDAAECSFDFVWAAPGLTLIPRPLGFEQLLDSSNSEGLAWTPGAWGRLIADEVRWAADPQSVGEIAGDSTLVVIGRVAFIDFDPIYVPNRDDYTQDAPRPLGLSYANLGVRVERVVAGEFRHHRADNIEVSVWQGGIPPVETWIHTDSTRPVLLFLQAKDAYFASRGIDPLTLIEGLDADTAAKVVAGWDAGYYLTSVQGVLIGTPDGLRNPLLPRERGTDGDASMSAVEHDSNSMSLSELERTIRDALPAYVAEDAIAEAVNYVPSPQFESMLYGYEYGPMSVDTSVRVGTLALEPPCAYLLVAPPSGADATTPPERHLLHLPRLGAQYDTETGELWVFGNGPFVTGDQVGAIGGEFAKGRDAPSCSYDNTWGTVHMQRPEDLP